MDFLDTANKLYDITDDAAGEVARISDDDLRYAATALMKSARAAHVALNYRCGFDVARVSSMLHEAGDLPPVELRNKATIAQQCVSAGASMSIDLHAGFIAWTLRQVEAISAELERRAVGAVN